MVRKFSKRRAPGLRYQVMQCSETRGPNLEGLEFQDERFGFGLRDLVLSG